MGSYAEGKGSESTEEADGEEVVQNKVLDKIHKGWIRRQPKHLFNFGTQAKSTVFKPMVKLGGNQTRRFVNARASMRIVSGNFDAYRVSSARPEIIVVRINQDRAY
jgi:hypothetical protein